MKKETLIREYLQKLRSKKGSALLLSLLFSTVSIIIATVILNAAASSNRRVDETAESSQAYYLVSSLFSVFEYEATSPKANPDVSVYAGRGMEFTAAIKIDPGWTIERAVVENAPMDGKTVSALTGALDAETNLNMLKNHVAFCLTRAMLTNAVAKRGFSVTASEGVHSYTISGIVSVNPVDYSIQVEITGISDTDNSDPEAPVTKALGLPDVRTLVFPTEQVDILERKTFLNTEPEPDRVTKARFVYQKAKYVSAS